MNDDVAIEKLVKNPIHKKKFTISISSLIVWIVLGTSVLVVITLLGVIQQQCNHTAIESAQTLFSEISNKTISNVNIVVKSISTLTDTASITFKGVNGSGADITFAEDTLSMKAMLDANKQLMSVYIGYGDGSFHQLIATTKDPFILQKYQAPSSTDYIDRVISSNQDGTRQQKWRFLDKDFVELSSRTDKHVKYDPRSRPWYLLAEQSNSRVYTEPYVFSSSRLPGLTCARALLNGGGVFGSDITLTQIGDMLIKQKVAKNGTIWILDKNNRLIAYPGMAWNEVIGDDLELPDASKSSDLLVKEVALNIGNAMHSSAKSLFLEIDKKIHIANITPMDAENGLSLSVVVIAPLKDITGYIGIMVFRVIMISFILLVLIIPLGILLSRCVSRSIETLVYEAEKIQQFDFAPSQPIDSSIKEVQKLSNAYGIMKSTIQKKTESLIKSKKKLEILIQSGLALSEEKELDKLVTLIFDNAIKLTNTDGGVLYLMEGEELEVEMLSLGSDSVVLGGLSKRPAPRVMVKPAITAFLSQDSVLRYACEAFNSKQIIYINKGPFSLFPTGLPEEPKDYKIDSLIAVPIITRRDEVIGVAQLFNPKDKELYTNHEIKGNHIIKFIESLAAQAAVTLDNRNLLNSLKNQLNGLIKIVAAAIDAKSPYTAGHCTRVPVLSEMLAKVAHETTEGPLKGFRLQTDDDWYQLWLAAWLHDCGKVTTPEYVVDKATKLETIHNRIHEIRMRFEVLRRDAEIDYLKKMLYSNEEPELLHQNMEQIFQQLDDEFTFIANCNIGGEFMSNEDQDRIKQISNRKWMRYFSDRIGISNAESRRIEDIPAPKLPTLEPLLADKPEHIIHRTKDYHHIKDAQGNPLTIPKNEYNRGEIYNLCIQRGTLTIEERFKIQEHTLSGIEMLSKIPFPENLSKVAEIASSHHEALNGTGYPLKKKRDQLSIESRILAIADIFEALTASDRPYRKSKTISEALRIMSFMRNDNHIDSALFDLFLEKNIFKQYAKQYLKPEQNNVHDVSIYMSSNKNPHNS